jgi:hypothetical protein
MTVRAAHDHAWLWSHARAMCVRVRSCACAWMGRAWPAQGPPVRHDRVGGPCKALRTRSPGHPRAAPPPSQVGGRLLPRGTVLYIPIALLHMREAVWPEPEVRPRARAPPSPRAQPRPGFAPLLRL